MKFALSFWKGRLVGANLSAYPVIWGSIAHLMGRRMLHPIPGTQARFYDKHSRFCGFRCEIRSGNRIVFSQLQVMNNLDAKQMQKCTVHPIHLPVSIPSKFIPAMFMSRPVVVGGSLQAKYWWSPSFLQHLLANELWKCCTEV
jgi:hypothetical protein